MNDVLIGIQEAINEKSGIATEDIQPSKELVADLGLDSLDAAEIIMSLEEKFGILISDEDSASFRTVNDIVVCIERSRPFL